MPRLHTALACACIATAMPGFGVPPSALANTVHAAEAPGYHVVDRIPMTNGWWDYATFDPVHRRLFISRGDGVFELDVATGLMNPQIIPGSQGRGVMVLPGGKLALEDMAGYSAAVLFDARTGRVRKLFSLRQAPDAAVWEPVTRRIWVMGSHGGVYILDPVSLRQTHRLDLGQPLEFAVVDGRGRVFINGATTGEVIAVDARTRKVIGRWKMKGCKEPTGMAYAAAAGVILSVCTNKMLAVLDARTGTELENVAVGAGADAVIYDPSTREALVPSAVDGLLTVLRVEGPRDVRVVELDHTQIGTRTGAVDPRTGTLYLPAARFGPVNKLGWPEALPGTVRLLVMKPRHAR